MRVQFLPILCERKTHVVLFLFLSRLAFEVIL